MQRFSVSSAASLRTVYMHGRVRTASRTTFEASSVSLFPRYAVATASAYALQAIPTCAGTHMKTKKERKKTDNPREGCGWEEGRYTATTQGF